MPVFYILIICCYTCSVIADIGQLTKPEDCEFASMGFWNLSYLSFRQFMSLVHRCLDFSCIESLIVYCVIYTTLYTLLAFCGSCIYCCHYFLAHFFSQYAVIMWPSCLRNPHLSLSTVADSRGVVGRPPY